MAEWERERGWGVDVFNVRCADVCVNYTGLSASQSAAVVSAENEMCVFVCG